MSKVRVHQFASETGVTSKEVINKLEKLGIEGKKAQSGLDERELSALKNSYNKSNNSGVEKKVIQKENHKVNKIEKEVKVEEKEVNKSQNSENKPNSNNVNSGERRPNPNGERRPNNNGERRPNPNGERRPNNNGERRPNPNGERRPYNNNGERRPNPNGERRPYNNNGERRPNPNGERRPYNNNGERRPNPNGERRPYNGNNNNGERRPYNGNNNNGERRPYNGNNNGERRPYNGNNNNGERRPYNGNNNNGERRPYNNNNGERRPYNGNNNNGERRPYNGNNNGERRPYNGNNNNGERRPYNGNNNNGERRPYNNNNNGERRPYNGNNNNGSRPYNNNGYKKNYNNQGGFQNRGSGYNKDDDDDDYRNTKNGQRAQRGKSDTKTGGEERPKTADKINRKNESRAKSKKKLENKESKWVEDNSVLVDLKTKKKKEVEIVKEEISLIEVPDTIILKELAEKLQVAPKDIILKLFKQGVIATVNQTIDFDTAVEIAESYDVLVEKEEEVDILEKAMQDDIENEDESDKEERPPVVVVMGHVDHGKTSLLDAIKKSKVTDGEHGGITQHIGAYTVEAGGKKITFLDTPGHEAFTAMRLRGAQVTDIAVLVVAADDGVMPQTIEAISHAKAAEVDIIVAINKIDKPGANPDKVKQELTEHGIVVEEWGGSNIAVPVSAKVGTGIDDLLEMINLSAEVHDLKASSKTRARGVVIEATLERGRGVVATVLVQSGTLKIGSPIVLGSAYGKVRTMVNDKGENITEATPSIPVKITGLSEVPNAGDLFYGAESDKQARQLASDINAQSRVNMIKNSQQKVSLDNLFSQIKDANVKELKLIVKADVQGSAEAVKSSLEKLSNEEVRIRVIHNGVGAINENDVTLAAASNAIIVGFNVRPDVNAKSVADREQVDLRLYNVIYHAIDDIILAMQGMYDPIFEEQVIGQVEVRQIFRSSASGTIAGSYVTDGKILRRASVRLKRDDEVIYDGDLENLKRFKDEVKEVVKGFECGIVLPKFNDIKEGDIFEVYEMVEVPRK
ncbi:MAG: translation initiation factor IF-2 [Lachnospirales bacterium]